MDGGYIKWEYYFRLYTEDCKNEAHRRFCPKLTIEHINPSNQMKMRVYLASQVNIFINICIHYKYFKLFQ